MEEIKSLYGDGIDVCLYSAIEGKMGTVWVDDHLKPELGLVSCADFYYILGRYHGEMSEQILTEHLSEAKGKIIKVTDKEWVSVLERLSPESFRRFNRYAIKKDPIAFNMKVLESYVAETEESYSIKRIDEEIYEKVLGDPFMADCCCFFRTKEDFIRNGRGYVIIIEDEIIAAASSYSYCDGFIDITIGTKEGFRNKGLAKAVASRLILECLYHGIYPVWDAVDMRSVDLAEKLGYTFDKAYEVYMMR